MSFTKYIYLTISLLYCGFVSAQSLTISGYITDKSSSETLIGATVINLKAKTGISSNEYGYYTLEIRTLPTQLQISYIGFQDLVVDIDENTPQTLNIELIPESNEIEEVVLSSKKLNQNVVSTKMSVVEVNLRSVKEIPSAVGIADVIKALEFLPGVSSPREGANGFNVRGGNADQNLILLDEATLYNSSHLLGFFSVINNDAIKNATLYKGSIPTEYGGRISSVLDIHQKDGNKKQFEAKGGIGLIASQIMVEGPIVKDKSSFMVAGRRSYFDLFLPLLPDENAKQSSLYFYDLNLKADYILNENNKLFLSGYFGRDAFKFSDTFENSWGNAALNIRWNHSFTQKLFSNLTFVWSKYDYSLTLKPQGSEFEWISNIVNRSLKYKFTYYKNTDHTFKWGTENIYYNFNPGQIDPLSPTSQIKSITLDKKQALQSDFYAAHKWQITPSIGIEYGLRYSNFLRLGGEKIRLYEEDKPNKWNGYIYEENCLGSCNEENAKFKQYGDNEVIDRQGGFEPRATLNYTLNETQSIKLGYNRNYQHIQLISNVASASPLAIWLPSGPYLKSMVGDQLSLGFFQNFNDNEYEASLEGYYKKLDNAVDYIDYAELLLNNYVETEMLQSEGRAYGIEFSLKKNGGKRAISELTFLERIRGQLSYTWSISERKTNETEGSGINFNEWYRTPFNREHDLSLSVSFDLNDNWTLSSNFVYYTGLPINVPVQSYYYGGSPNVHYTGERNVDKMEDYHRMDVSAVWTLDYDPKQDWFEQEWVFSIYNVYNHLNASAVTFELNFGDGYDWSESQFNAYKITYFAFLPTVTWNFKF